MSSSPTLRVTGLYKRFGDVEVLRGIDAVAHRGDVISILGSSGSGKSTFLRCINLLRTRVGMVFQSFNLWPHMTALENVVEASLHVLNTPRREALEKGRALLEKVGLPGKERSFPSELSGGQQQRVAIARALCVDPEVLLFDEPTSALDPELVGEVLQVMRLLAEEGRTMLVVTHEMAFARDVSNHAIFFHEGRIEEQGPPATLFKSPQSERLRQFLARST
jgi:ABC-type histidine transport system ATPase subunit